MVSCMEFLNGGANNAESTWFKQKYGGRPIKVAITGAAGQIGYSLTQQIASGQMFGENQKVSLRLIDLPFANEAMNGVHMELDDSYFPLVSEVIKTDDPEVGFEGADAAVLLGAFPRKAGMERKDLMEKNIGIFKVMGEAANKKASSDIKVLVVGNPANTNALVMSHFAPNIPKENFTAMTRLDHNRMRGVLANKAGVNASAVENVIVWGNHSSTMYPDVHHATISGKPVYDMLDKDWLQGEFVKTIQGRGAAVIKARGASSAMSAARGATTHMRSWFLGTAPGEYVSMGVSSDGSDYGFGKDLMYSLPCSCKNGKWEVVKGLNINDYSKGMMKATEDELKEEKDIAMSLV